MEQEEQTYLSNSQGYQRPIAALIDYVIIFLLSIFGFLGMNYPLSNSEYAKNEYSIFMKCYLESDLYYEEVAPDGKVTYVPHKYETYEEYETLLTNFFFDYMNENAKTDKYNTYWYNVFVYGQDDVLKTYTEEQLNTRYVELTEIGKTLFAYQKDESGNILSDVLAKPIKNTTDEDKKALTDFYFSTNKPSVYGLAVHMLTMQDFFIPSKDAYANWYTFTMYMPLSISIAVFAIIFRYIIPLFSKSRQTIGKRLMKIGVFNEDGTRLSTLKFTIRSFIPLVVVEGLLAISNFYMGGNMSSFFLFTIALGVTSFALSAFTKKRTALHDLPVNSRVYDLKTSVLPSEKSTSDDVIEEEVDVKDGE